ncbi:sigma-70 family RNA polymerase sigma factor [Cohnella candidum]|uniref:Sigma-70 family RNA polymerase sigma factor n=1 Tax=Cohnella candidum TaxID=2674991 RepID=A0A3G3JYE8_9BACL|nr:sigma-70 family RNA polymerase sigma factor [Cohnella candidum]AYQ73278.1 sigma-70 family RNA polymerase sigma factor [Cohnella candidum]
MNDGIRHTDIRLAASGDREAFSRLIRDSQLELYKMARSMLRQDEDVADAIQETILKAYRHITRLREPAYFRTWLFRILIRECMAASRRKRRFAAFLANMPKAPAIARAAGDMDLHDAVDRLGEPARTIVKLHYFADQPIAEIAAVLNISEGTVKSKLYRARKKLAKTLTEPEEGGVGYELH